jgi:hypothetical protein
VHELFPRDPRFIARPERYRALCANWTFSQGALRQLRDGLRTGLPEGVMTIAIAGSFARYEASDQSDADCIIVLEDDPKLDAAAVSERAVATVTEHIAALGIPESNPKGVFAVPRRFSELLPEPALGALGGPDEPSDILGKRMLMLLESRPLFNDDAYRECIDAIFERYAFYVLSDRAKEHLFLLNDLIRYFRFICVNYQSNFEREYEKWPLRNLKLRHSRIVMYMGLLALIGESSKYVDEGKIEYVRDKLPLTPLERIAAVYGDNNDTSFFRVAGLYNTFLARISDADLRQEINRLEYEDRYDNILFSALKANSDALQAELTRFIYARRGSWSERFFEYLIF